MPRCLLCKEKFKPKYFLMKHCMEKDECIQAEIEMKKATIWKEKRKELKVETHSKEYRKYLQDEINLLSRLIDEAFGFDTCIDCNKPFGSHQIDACHLISRKKNNSLRWNLHNLHRGHNHCNFYNEKHEGNFKEGIIRRYGKEYLEEIEGLTLKYPKIKLSNKEVHEKLILVRKINRNFYTYKLEHPIATREMFNKIIGIYN